MTLGLVTLRWIFMCEIIPEQPTEINESQMDDGPTVLYNHFILPMMIVTLGLRQQFKSLVDVIKGKEKEADELSEIVKKSDSLAPALSMCVLAIYINIYSCRWIFIVLYIYS